MCTPQRSQQVGTPRERTPFRAVKKVLCPPPLLPALVLSPRTRLPRPSDLRTGGGCLSAMSERTAAHRGARRRTRAGHRGAWPTRFTHRPTRGSLVGLSQLAKAAESVLKRHAVDYTKTDLGWDEDEQERVWHRDAIHGCPSGCWEVDDYRKKEVKRITEVGSSATAVKDTELD